MNYNSKLLVAGCLLLAVFAFQKKSVITREELIEQTVQERLVEYEAILVKQCLEKAFVKAEALVDSLLIEEARASVDTTGRPGKPLKPEAPQRQLPKDSAAVKPLFGG